MKKIFKIPLVILLVLLILITYHALNFYFPSNVISKIIKGFTVVITPVLIALVIMYLINPLSQMFVKKYKMNKKASIALSMFIFFGAIIALLTFNVIFIVDQGKLLYDQITDPAFLQSIENWFARNNISKVYEVAVDFIKSFNFSSLTASAGSLVSTVLQSIASIILAPIFLWHFMNSQEVVMDKVTDNIPERWQDKLIPILNDSNKVIVTYFRSKIVSIIILFFMFLVLYVGLGIPVGYAILFALLISFLDLIPYLGPSIGSIIPVLYLFSVGGTNLLYIESIHLTPLIASIIMLGINVTFQYIQGNIIVPQLIGKEMEINSALILVFMLFFGYVLGFWGIILSIPLGGIILVVWKHIKDSGFLLDKNKVVNNEEEIIQENTEEQ